MINRYMQFYLNMLKQCKIISSFEFHANLIVSNFSVTITGMKTRLIADNELLAIHFPLDQLPKELLCQINCWNDNRNEIDL